MSQLPSEITFWSWAARGLGGIMTVMEGLLSHGPRLTGSQLAMIKAEQTRLNDIVAGLEKRLIENAAEFHGPDTDWSTAGSETADAQSAAVASANRGDINPGSSGGNIAAGSGVASGSGSY
jgi:hypothetical protein